MEPKYSFVRANLDTSQAQVAALWAQGLGTLIDRAAAQKYQQFYLDNPVGRGDCVLLVENSGGRAVGVQGFVPRRFWRGNVSVDAAAMADFVVVPEHRSLGPALKLMRTGIELGKARFAFLYGTPNEKSSAIVRRAGLPTIGMLTRYTKVIRSASYWRRRIPRWLVIPAAMLADAAIIGTDLGHALLRGRPYLWGERSEFGPEIEAVWERREPEGVYGDRSAAILAWRYPSNGRSGSRRISVAMDRSGVPAGYVVWRNLHDTAMVSDFLFSGTDTALRTFLHAFAWYVRQFGVDRVSLEFFGREGVVHALTKSGFASREQSPIVCVDHAAGGVFISPSVAYVTSFDRDHGE